MWVWAVKNGIFRICENGISRSNTGNTKTIGIQGKPFSTRFRICHPVFRIDSEFVRKYENEPVKCRNRSGTERDISRPFSTLVPGEFHPQLTQRCYLCRPLLCMLASQARSFLEFATTCVRRWGPKLALPLARRVLRQRPITFGREGTDGRMFLQAASLVGWVGFGFQGRPNLSLIYRIIYFWKII